MPGGRPKLPDEIKAKKGTLQNCRVNKNKPKMDYLIADDIKAPTYLNKYAKKFYIKFGLLMIEKGVLTNADLESLEILSNEYGKYIEASVKLNTEGYVITGTNKLGATYEMVSPWVNIASTAFKNYNSLVSKFGLTPSDRGKISVVEKKNATGPDLDSFLN